MQEWEKSDLASVIIMAGAGNKAFCAGGDVAALAQYNNEGPEGQARSIAYFGLEYQLDHLIATYSKPYIAYMDGITMGGGVGLSVHAPLRVATERTVFSMPETTIGFFPDVGASFFLPRMEGEIGTYLALTSERLNGVNAFYAGIATHYIDSSSLGALTGRLSELVFKDYASMAERLTLINDTIEEFGTGLPHDVPMLLAGELRNAIDRCFQYDQIEEIVGALDHERRNGPMQEWADKTLTTLSERSPTSLKVTLKQMRIGRKWSISETFAREHYIASCFMTHPDFVNGVSARLIQKPPVSPVWNPPQLSGVSQDNVDSFFRSEGSHRLNLLGGKNYTEYPFGHLALPRESDVAKIVRDGGMSSAEVVNGFLRQKNGKVGVREKVEEILKRKCHTDENGKLVWRSS